MNKEEIIKAAKDMADKIFGKLPSPQQECFKFTFEQGFVAALDMLMKLPFDEALDALVAYADETERERIEHIKAYDLYYLLQMPEEEYIRQFKKNGADIGEYMRIHHPEKAGEQCGDTK